MNKKIILAAASLAIAASSAMAAEGKYYVKGNLGYGMSKHDLIATKLNNATPASQSFKKTGKGLIGGLGLGANLGSNVRTDLEFLMDDGLKSKTNASASTYGANYKVSSYAFLLNAHYDFKNSSKLTPFVTAGVGYGHNKHKVSIANKAGSFNKNFTKSGNGFAYQLGLGAAYNLGKVDLELGYRFIDKGAKKVTITPDAQNSIKTKKSSGQVNAIMAGVRVGF